MSLAKTYAWYIEDGKLGIIEMADENDTDTGTEWTSISTAGKTIRMLATHRATDFDTTLSDDNKTYNLPNRYRYMLADYVIARGYENPINQNLKAAGYYLNKFRNGMRTIKKNVRSRNRYGVSPIRRHYF